MSTALDQIRAADAAICGAINALTPDRPLLSQQMLGQLRNLVEGVAVRWSTGQPSTDYNYDAIKAALDDLGSAPKKLHFLKRFHKLLQESASHYVVDGDASERLMLKYYEYLMRLRDFAQAEWSFAVLSNLEKFPVDLDPSLREYHQKIAERIHAGRQGLRTPGRRDRYYVLKTRPFFVGGRIYYEVTFQDAKDHTSKTERHIAFTDIDMTDKYASNLTLIDDEIEVLDHTMPVRVITDWEVSIRPCEFENFGGIFGEYSKVSTGQTEYRHLMQYLTETGTNLLDVMALAETKFQKLSDEATQRAQKSIIFPVLTKARQLIARKAAGHNVIRYLLLRMRNETIKLQYYPEGCGGLSNLNLSWGCKPFDTMPLCTSALGHNPRFSDLIESLDSASRKHELLAHRVKTDVEQRGMLYTPKYEVERFEDIDQLMRAYNGRLYYKHKPGRCLVEDRGHLFISEYEQDTIAIIQELQSHASAGIDGYADAVEFWLNEAPRDIDDPLKRDALKRLFAQSGVAMIYGAAGTGKSTMINHIASYFHDKEKLFLAHTNPAVDNLKRRVTTSGSDFRTISRQLRNPSAKHYDVLVIDECSTVSNADFLKVLQQTSFSLLVLVGDVFQIESIQFGNWFALAPAFLPKASVFELTTPYRTKNDNLLRFWSAVRGIDDNITEIIAAQKYSARLDETLFAPQKDDEIILCLNYEGLYGINNINQFLQSGNPNPATAWGVSTYKVGDPVLFNDSARFRGVIYNNLKGRIVGIEEVPGRIQFDVKLERAITEFEVTGPELVWLGDATVRFSVFAHGSTDDDDQDLNTSVPFQVAYAVSIHKAQGLEYDSVKVVITDANEDSFSHSIFYTAITRARENLKIFWTPETQHAVIAKLDRPNSKKDVGILSSRSALKPM
ncbi:ATP-dependent RecD-like DNA helicase [Rathayibacter sp. AY2B5]|uniref:ATP-dependent DNA helicase n=1 Tax=Rathayibacter sp. AY2B5 TaxID=2080570 RepID=UPI000CE7D35C|nr:ATP-dependent RecD-like DNA helicase [Rathayibacter sp. AY2B5]PPG44398.1 helicase [Rathayibacter sp. AY2B5]